MPILFNENPVVSVFSIYKIITSALFIILVFFYKRNFKNSLIIILIPILFAPLLLAIDLVTTNFFTYFRYIFPYNVFSITIILSCLVAYSKKLFND